MRTCLWTLAILFIGFWHYGVDYWCSKWAVMLAILVVPIGLRIGRKWTPSAGAAFTWTVLSGLSVFAWQDNYLTKFNLLEATATDESSAAALVAFLAIAWLISEWESWDFTAIRRAFGVACLADSLWVLSQIIRDHHGHAFVQGGFFDQGSVNGCFIAATFPFALELFHDRARWALFVPPAAVALTCLFDGASNAFGVSMVVGLALVFSDLLSNRRVLVAGAEVAFVTLVFLYFNPGLFSSSGRFTMYGLIWKTFQDVDPLRWFFGMGNGTFLMLGPIIQREANFMPIRGGLWPWLHSDWLQTGFEQGALGLALYLWLAWDCFRRARGDRYLFAVFLGVCATAVFQYPVHLSLFAFLIAAVVAMCLKSQCTVSSPAAKNLR